MSDITVAQHPPAMKVAGRRLSVSRPRPHVPAPEQKPPSPAEDERPDYPRPAPPGEQQAHNPDHVHDDHDEVPRKEKRRGHGSPDHERRVQESLMRKAEQNRPTKDLGGNAPIKGAVGGGGRIGQPAGKGFAV
ncbi:hypothetical protein EUX98_g3953 [Antrodiella citrinella]|uniref:Uncharacterized protein n=1 Tax=Antrodiella citrinella TaxID=2447956 RepID=A0A4S4MV86_9APHY|nr:hypothetical protein EUX98_g3953 [Antrodiella citrinella]